MKEISCKRVGALLCLFFLALTFGAGGAGADDLDRNRRDLKDVRNRIENTAKDLERKRSAEKSLAAELAAVERELARVEKEISALDREIGRVDKDLSGARSEIQRLEADLASLRNKLGRRIVALYKNGRSGPLRTFFSAESPLDAAEDYDFLSRIVRRDRDLLQEYRQRSRNLKSQIGKLEHLKSQKGALLQSVRGRRDDRQRVLARKEKILAGVRRERIALGGRLDDLKEREKGLAALIKKLESRKTREYTQSVDFASRKGRLRWPATGVLKKKFGTWKDPGTGTLLDNQGIEIAVSGERPVKAVWSGKVAFANQLKGYGNLLILDHGDSYFSLYAQTERLARKVGDRVREGEVLAFPEEGRLYFEIRHRGTPLDPGAWLAPRP